MPTIAIIYATTEGQTRKIAKGIRDRFLELGWKTRLYDAVDHPDADALDGVDAVILAGSIHVHHFQTSLAHFAKENAARLNSIPSAFCAVSLSAVGDKDEKDGASQCAQSFAEETGWQPTMVHHAAGALMFTKYDFFRTWIMKRIAKEHDLEMHGRDDVEFTDWDEIAKFVDGFANDIQYSNVS